MTFDEIDQLAEEQLREFNELTALLKVPDDVLEEFGTSPFMLRMYQNLEGFDPSAKQKLIEAKENVRKLRAAVPRHSRSAVEELCLGYSMLVTCFFDDRFAPKERSEAADIKLLLDIAMLRGAVLGSFSQEVRLAYETKRRQAKAGQKGAASKQRPFGAVKAWALSMAASMRGADIDIARKLARQMPSDLVGASRDPERLIYETLRARKAKA